MNSMLPTPQLPAPIGTPPHLIPGSSSYRDDSKIFFSDILAAIRRHWRAALIGAAVVAVLVLFAATLFTPLYRSTATVMIDTRHQETVNVRDVLSGLPSDSFVVDSEVEVLKSTTLAERVIKSLGLDNDPEFNPSLRPQTFWSSIGDGLRSVKDAGMDVLRSVGILAPPPPSAPGEDRNHAAVLAIFQYNLDVDRRGLTYAISVSFASEDAAKSARIANALADAYLAQQIDMKTLATQQANGMLDTRVSTLRGEVEKAERAVADYKSKHGLLNAVGSNLTEQSITALSTELATARAEQAQQEGKLAAALEQAKNGGAESVGEAVTSDTVRVLRQQQAEVYRQKADLETRYGDKHPSVVKIRREAEDIDKAINAEIQRIIGSLKAGAIAARERTASLQGSINGQRSILAGNNEAMVELGELQRNADAVRSLYESFLGRLKETTEQAGMQRTDAQVISRAVVPLNAVFPPWGLVKAAALVLALMAAGAIITLLEFIDSRVKSPEDVEREAGFPVLATIPQIAHRDPGAYVVEKPLSRYAESLRNLEASLFYSQNVSHPKVVAIMSSLPGEGKTTCVIGLARLASMSGLRVAVVDADLRRRSLSRQLKLESGPGLYEAISGTLPIDQCLCKDPLSSVMILPANNELPANKDVYVGQELEHVFEKLRGMFDVVIIDTSPILLVADTRLVARHVDAAVMLTRWRGTPKSAVADAVKAARLTNVPIIGMVLTRVDFSRQSGFGYASGKDEFGKYYANYYIE